MFSYLILSLVIILLLCRNNLNIEKFNNRIFNNRIVSRCLESLNITKNINCRKEKFCKDNYNTEECDIAETITKCDDTEISNAEIDTAVILNASDMNKDVGNRRSYRNFLESVEISSLQNNNTWCEF